MKRLIFFGLLGYSLLISCTQSTPTYKDSQTSEASAKKDPILVIESQGHSAIIEDIMFTPDGKTLISVSKDKTIRLWDVETGDLIRTIRGQIGEGIEGKIWAGALSHDGKILAVGGFFVTTKKIKVVPIIQRIRLFNLETGEQIGLFDKKYTWYGILALAFSGDGKWLASACEEGAIRIWEVSDAGNVTLMRTLKHNDIVYDIAFSPDGKKLVSASRDGTLRLWVLPEDLRGFRNLEGLKYTEMKKHTGEVLCVDYAPNGKYIVSGEKDGKVFLWDGDGNFIKEIDEYSGPVGTVSFSSDSKRIVTCGTHASIYAIPSGERITTFTKHTGGVVASAFYGTNWVATAGGEHNDIYIWDATSGMMKTHIVGKGKPVWAVAFGKNFNVAFGNTVHAPLEIDHDILDSAQYADYPEGFPLEKSFDFSKMFLNQSLPLESKFRRIQTEYRGKTLKRINAYKLRVTGGGTIESAPGFGGQIRSYTFMKDGNVVVGKEWLVLYRNDGIPLRWFSERTGTAWAVSGIVLAVSISENGRILASASDDQTIKLWNLRSGELLATLFVTDDNEWICWTPQGYYDASADGEQYIGWHVNRGADNAAEFYPVSVFRKKFYRPELVKRTIELGNFEQVNAEFKTKFPEDSEETTIVGLLPPKVQWISPKGYSTETLDPFVWIHAKIHSDSKITKMELRVNGRPQATDQELRIIGRESLFYKEIEHKVTLIPGENKISIYAKNENTGHTSDLRIVSYYPREGERRKPNLYMVSIGISEYQINTLKLNYADDDARAIGQLFRSQEGKMYEKVKMKPLYDRDATRHEILDALEWLEEQIPMPKDMAIIFVAAHGYNSPRGTYYLLPADGNPEKLLHTAVSWTNFLEILSGLPSQVLVFLDTCHSGQVDQNLYHEWVDNTEALRGLKEKGVVVLAASTGGNVSIEHAEWGHGAFTKALLEALEDGRAESSTDGFVYLEGLKKYVYARVKDLTEGKQYPTMVPSKIRGFPIAKVN